MDEEETGKSRFVLFPIRHQEVWDMYIKARRSIWFVEEIDLAGDISVWNDVLNDNERKFLKTVLAYFAASDGIVDENIAANFYVEAKIPEIRAFFATQIFVETIHSETYSILLDAYIQNKEERESLLQAIETVPAVKLKADWTFKWMDQTTKPLALRIIAFAIVEGVFFSSSFCAIFWVDGHHEGKLKGLKTSNKFISTDEGMHCDFGCLLFNKYMREKSLADGSVSEDIVKGMFREAVEIESIFVKDALPIHLLGMNADLMIQYVKFCADRLLVALGFTKLYDAKNPFDFMDKISIESKTNFFEHRVTEYSKMKSNVPPATSNKGAFVFTTTDDF
jgi:ribonucleotide reductase beta subunit family protein with ferritin-like domain